MTDFSTDAAVSVIERYARTHAYFSAEDVARYSLTLRHFTQPADDRKWGPAYQKAARLGLIELSGTTRRRRGHLAVGNLWRSRLCSEVAA